MMVVIQLLRDLLWAAFWSAVIVGVFVVILVMARIWGMYSG